MSRMDTLNMISGGLFFAADSLAVASLAMPNWIESDIGGTQIGLLRTCLTIYQKPPVCFTPNKIRSEWLLTCICIMVGIVCISTAVLLLFMSYWKYTVVKFARWLGFVAMILFCLAAVIFPIGFDMDQIGGNAYQLPANYRVGLSYIFFVLSQWITVVAELVAIKVCLPHI